MQINRSIFLTSNEPWGDIWFSKQHYAYELSKIGHNVYFLNPTEKWSWKNLLSFKLNTNKINDNLVIVDYKNNFPQRIFPKFFTAVNDFINCFKLNLKINTKQLIWWKFDPYRFLSSFPYKENLHIYHVVDPHMHIWQNNIQANNANLIVCTSPKYTTYFKKLKFNKILQLQHGISEEEFNIDKLKVESIQEKYGKFAIIVGTIADDVAIDLLYKITLEQINIVVIGDELIETKEWSMVKESKHFYYLGRMHAKELNNYIAASKVGLIAYNFTPGKNQISRSPLKVLNYLAQYKPIITSIDSEINELANEGIFRANNPNDYIDLVNKAMNSELMINSEKIRAYLADHKYPKLIADIFNHLEN